MKEQQIQITYILGGSITLFGAIAQFLKYTFAPYVFAVGATLLIIYQLKVALDNRKSDMRIQRLSRMNFLASLLLAIATYLMFENSNLWVVGVLIYALVSLFISFRGE